MLPSSYFVAREDFRTAADSRSWQWSALPISSRGPANEELTIDVAWSTDQRDLPTLIISSGLHGVEGFFGAALQIALLHANADLRGVRLVLIHALNPYGFAHVRRFDADNIDPNRNFLLPGEPFAGAPDGYAELDALLNPRSPQSRWDWFQLRAAYAVLRHGMPRLKQAIAAGQYEFPQGLFFGGKQPGETQQLLLAHLPDWVAGAPRVVHFDLHSGLGRRARRSCSSIRR
ncbi:M14 family metallopeptidase [Anatilimnocola floriformis]|uniref:M14 family metallopeptidase n=1 Tax=Anatilimnocola floriformis TaxID=2948575 RepID=UPI0020C57087|nr:M14 family metallopeptidase [Anatilimnocola floriformis]